jgi:hypothetical protein
VAQPIQLKRRVTGPGTPATLLPGEPAYNSSGQTLYIGDGTGTVQLLVGANRQVEVTGPQAITGPKTLAIADLKLIGGALGNIVRTDGAGNLSFIAPPLPLAATVPEMVAGTSNIVYGTPLNIMGLTGLTVTA